MDQSTMSKGESITRLAQGAAIGAVAAMVIGFAWGGWMLESSAAERAENDAKSAVVTALAPLCVDNFRSAADAVDKLEALKQESSYKQTAFVEKGGWATFPGSDKASRDVAKACVALLKDLDLAAS